MKVRVVLEPISGPSVQGSKTLERYRKNVVDEYLANKSSFNKFPSRHYSQLEVSFDALSELLRRLQIIGDLTVLIFAGYTGQFANALRNLGMRVIFTDVLQEWVTEAKASGLEAYRHEAEDIPGNLLGRAQLVATFECYDQILRSSVYNSLRFLTRDQGLLFAESKQTRKEMQAEGRTWEMRSRGFPYHKVYAIKIVRREKNELKLCHYYASTPESKDMMLTDALVIKAVHDNLQTETTFTLERLLSIPSISWMSKDSLDQSLNRIMAVHYYGLLFDRRFQRSICIGAK